MCTSVSKLNFDGTCRTCMSEGNNLSSLYDYATRDDDMQNPVRIVDLLNATVPQITPVEQTDTLAKKICLDCINKLLSYHDFQEMCLQSEKCMRELVTEAENMDSKILVLSDDNVINAEAENDEMIEFKEEIDSLGEFRTDEEEIEEVVGDPDDNIVMVKIERSSADSEEQSANDDEGSLSHAEEEMVDEMDEEYLVDQLLEGEQSEGRIKEKLYDCSLCSSQFTTMFALRRHERNIHNIVVLSNGEKSVLVANPKKSREPKPKRPTVSHTCEYCNKTFKNICVLRDHINIHTGDKPYLCSECGKSFKCINTIRMHLKRHSDTRDYECPLCPRRFRTLGDLNSHRSTHTKEKPHICDICGKGFARNYVLKNHRMCHTGEKPYKCEYCEARFSVVGKMRRHMLTHTGEKPYPCKYCDRAFAQSNDLNKHLRSHIGENIYKCELCPQSFRMHTEMREHFALHKMDDEETRARNLKAKMEQEQQSIVIK